MKSTYIMGDNSGYVKIGRSNNIEKRLKDLSTGNPTLKLLFEYNGDIEKRLHGMYSFWNVPSLGKEWYNLSQDMIEKLVNREHFKLCDEDAWEEWISNKKRLLES